MEASAQANQALHSIPEAAQELAPELIALRHELHQIPELALELPHTQNTVLEAIADCSELEITHCNSATGFVAVLRGGHAPTGGRQRPIVLLRADMDALPVQETTQLPWASTNGNMHACGHDLHMAGLVGALKILYARRQELAGDIIFMFQSGEEGHDGAQHMIDEGLLEAAGRTPDHAYGLHVWASRYPAGFIGTRPGAMMASSDTVAITIKGRGGHGSAPHETLDPIPVAAEIITQAQVLVTREFNAFDPVVISCGQVHSGHAANVINDDAFLEFTLRAFSPKNCENLILRLQALAEDIARAHRMEAEVHITRLYPVTMNNAQEYEFAKNTVEAIFPGRWQLQETPMAAAEDFSKVLERIPGVFIGVSAVEAGGDHTSLPFNHSGEAQFSDHTVPDCAAILASLAYQRLTSTNTTTNPETTT